MVSAEFIMAAYIIKDIGSMAISYFSSSSNKNNDREERYYERPNNDIQLILMNENLHKIGDQQSKLIFVVELILGVIILAMLVAFVLISIIILIMALYSSWKFIRWMTGWNRNAMQFETRAMIENVGQRLYTPNGQHINRKTEEEKVNERDKLNSEILYRMQIEEAKRQSLEDVVKKLEKDRQQKELKKSSCHSQDQYQELAEEQQLGESRKLSSRNLGKHSLGDVHQRRKPIKAFKKELEKDPYKPTADMDGGLQRRKRCGSSKIQNDITTDRLDDFQKNKLLCYKSARGVDDIEDFPSDFYRGADDESNTRQVTTTYDDEEENFQLDIATAIYLSLAEQNGEITHKGI